MCGLTEGNGLQPNAGSQLVQQPLVNAAETAIAEHRDDIAFACVLLQPRDNRVHVRLVKSQPTCLREIINDTRRVESLVGLELIEPRNLPKE